MSAKLILENGTCPTGSNAYATTAMCDTWQGIRNSETWPPAPADGEDPNLAAKESALIKATDYLNGLNWRGKRADGGRLMAWPRVDTVTVDGYPVPEKSVPDAVKAANCYLAGLVYAETDLQPILERGGRVQTEKVGSLATTYFDDAADRDIFSALTDLLSMLVIGFEANPTGDSGGGFSIGRLVVG